MRPRSIIGPLLLIAIGALFLWNNLRPDLNYFELVARYWPWILIVWGGLRLVEVLVWFTRGRLTHDSGVGGGAWVLVVFICLIGSGMFFVTGSNFRGRFPGFIRGVEVFGEAYDFAIPEQKIAAPGKPFRVIIDNQRGNARLVAGEGNEVRVSGRKSIRAMSRAEAEEADKAANLDVVMQGDAVLIRTNQERVQGEKKISTDIDIVIPKTVSVDARGRYGDFDVTGITGDVEVNSDNAGVRLQNIGGNVRIDTRRSDVIRIAAVKGTVDLRGKGHDLEIDGVEGQVNITAAYFGDIELRNLAKPVRMDADRNGNTQLEMPKLPGRVRMDMRNFTGEDLVGPVKLTAKSLDVQIGDCTQQLDVSLDRGDVELRPTKAALAKTNIRTRSGNIEFAVPPAARFQLKATTNRGEIDNQFGAPLSMQRESERSRDRGKRMVGLSGTIGQGPLVELTTDRGSVTVRKGGNHEAPAAPAAPALPAPPKPPQPPAGALQVEKQ